MKRKLSLLLALMLVVVCCLCLSACKDGVDGKDGIDGKDGVAYKDFTYDMFTPKQLEALRGSQGQTGASGQSGLSAYQLYKKNNPNYTGSETEWLNDLANIQLYVCSKGSFFKLFE